MRRMSKVSRKTYRDVKKGRSWAGAGGGKRGEVWAGSCALRLPGEHLLTGSVRHEARAGETKGGNGEPRRVDHLEVDHCCSLEEYVQQESRIEGRADHLLYLKC